ncbi:MAG: agmatine deiminase family protein [Planctomycetota bacterium]
MNVGAVRLPAEWETPAAIWIAWPHNRNTWPERFDPVPAVFSEIVAKLTDAVDVCILATPDLQGPASQRLAAARADARRIRWFPIATNDCWIRDYGPQFLRRQESGSTSLVAVDFRFNAWGRKYSPFDDDDRAGGTIAASASVACHRSSLIVEGGALETDGQGRLLTTTACLTDEDRNPGCSVDEIASKLNQLLGIDEIVWLEGKGLEGDDTDGHIDQLARFIDRRNVVVAACDDPNDPNHDTLQQHYHQLRLWADQTHPRVEVHQLLIPAAREIDGHRLPESYCNFLRVGPSMILLPTFRCPESDRRATDMLQSLCHSAKIVPVDCYDLSWGLGAIHCATLNQPRP